MVHEDNERRTRDGLGVLNGFSFLFLIIGFFGFSQGVFCLLERTVRGEVVMPGCDVLSAHVLLRVG